MNRSGGRIGSENAESKIKTAVQALRDGFHPEKIILFGSHARGTAGPESDLDFLVVVPKTNSRRRKAVEMDMALAKLGMSKDILVVTPEDLEKSANFPGRVVAGAVAEGRTLYDREA